MPATIALLVLTKGKRSGMLVKDPVSQLKTQLDPLAIPYFLNG
jgi:hypothetical protein